MRALTKPQMSALGERFRAAREARGLTLSDVAEQIRIRSVYLAAIEDEDWDAIGAPVYVRGFLRTYGRYLGLDPEDAVADFNRSLAASASAQAQPASTYYPPSRPLSPMVWVAGIVAVVLVALVIYSYLGLRKNAHGPLAAATGRSPVASQVPLAQASASSGAVAVAKASVPNTLTLRFASASWVRVTIDGSVRVEGTFPKGTVKTFSGKSALIRAGNAGGIDVSLDGKAAGKLGAVGQVIERAYTF